MDWDFQKMLGEKSTDMEFSKNAAATTDPKRKKTRAKLLQ